MPLKVEYVLTPVGEQIIPALDLLYIWSIRRMDALKIPIDLDAFVVHNAEKYVREVGDIMKANNFLPDDEPQRKYKKGN
jgi:hypothetical protein